MTHYEPHLVNGFCVCDCEDCHAPLTNGCWCFDCDCEDDLDANHFVEC